MANQVVYNITFTGNAAAFTSQLTDGMGTVKNATEKATGAFSKFQAHLIALNQGIQVLRDFSQTLRETSEPGLKLNASMQDLSAITGVAGAKLKEIEGYARAAAKTFGGSAAQGVESYKLILSKLSPEIAKVPKALQAMGNSAMTLSKTMGNDVVAATQVLTTAMNQYQVSLDDPIKASQVMSEMMNIMAAAAKEGSAELPEIQAALEQAGMAAKMAGVSFAETNAAIQVLDKAGKKGAEGGVAIRNVLATLSEGRFLPKEVLEELNAAGVSVDTLANKSLPLAERLTELRKIFNDSALVTKLFGKENSNAALALISGIPLLQQYTEAVQGTKSAEEQAAVVMQSKEEQLARIKAKVDDYKISIFNLTGNMLPFTEIAVSALVPIAEMIPLISGLSKGIKAFSFTAVIAGFASFKVAAIASCRAVGVAIMSIPVFGWIAAAIAALAAAIAIAWNKFEGFRKTILGVWEVVKQFGVTLYDSILVVIKSIISGLGSLGKTLMKLFKADFKGAAIEAKNAAQSFLQANPLLIGVKIATTDYKKAWKNGQDKGTASWTSSKDSTSQTETASTESSIISIPDISMSPIARTAKKAATSWLKIFAENLEIANRKKKYTVTAKIDLKAADGVKKLNLYNDTIEELKKKMKSATDLSSIFGNAQSMLEEKIDLIKVAITKLNDAGFSLQSKEIQDLIEQYKKLQSELDKTKNKTREYQELTQKGMGYLSSIVSSVGNILGGQAGDWLNWAANAISTIASVISEVASLYAAQMAAGVAKQASLGWPYNLVAMASTVAGALSIISSIPKLADGGIASGPTMAMVGEYPGASNNPEVIAPLHKLKQMLGVPGMSGEVRFVIEQDKLVGILNKYNRRVALS